MKLSRQENSVAKAIKFEIFIAGVVTLAALCSATGLNEIEVKFSVKHLKEIGVITAYSSMFGEEFEIEQQCMRGDEVTDYVIDSVIDEYSYYDDSFRKAARRMVENSIYPDCRLSELSKIAHFYSA